jgi:hypothetical protein
VEAQRGQLQVESWKGILDHDELLAYVGFVSLRVSVEILPIAVSAPIQRT